MCGAAASLSLDERVKSQVIFLRGGLYGKKCGRQGVSVVVLGRGLVSFDAVGRLYIAIIWCVVTSVGRPYKWGD